MDSNQMNKITTEMAEHICDNLCKYPEQCGEDELANICCDCKMGKFVCDLLNIAQENIETKGERSNTES